MIAMTAAALRHLLHAHGLPAALWQLADANFHPASAGWVEANWQAWVAARPAKLVTTRRIGGGKLVRAPLWLADAGDCDNLALGCMVHGQVGNALRALEPGERPPGGLAFGVLFFHQAKGGAHAINWWLDHESRVKFFEPGTGAEIQLTAQERSSAWFGLAA